MAESDGSSEPKEKNSSSIMNFSSILASAVMHQISLPKFLSASGSTSSISIDQIKLGCICLRSKTGWVNIKRSHG